LFLGFSCGVLGFSGFGFLVLVFAGLWLLMFFLDFEWGWFFCLVRSVVFAGSLVWVCVVCRCVVFSVSGCLSAGFVSYGFEGWECSGLWFWFLGVFLWCF